MPSIPESHWAQVFDAHGSDLKYDKVPIPIPGPDEVLVNLKYSGLCHSSVHSKMGRRLSRTRERFIDGHEGAGVVVSRGEKVSDVQIGDHVGIQWINRTCGKCDACDRSDYLFCPTARFTGDSVDGTFAQYCLCQASKTVRIPENVPLQNVVPLLCTGLVAHKAVKECNAKPGDTITIIGKSGSLLSMACQYAKAAGYQVSVISAGLEATQMCTDKLGVEYFIDQNQTEDPVSEIKRLTNGGVQAAIILEAWESSYQLGLECVLPRGNVVIVGLPHGKTATADLSNSVARMVNVKVSFGGSQSDTKEAMDVYLNGGFHKSHQIKNLKELPSLLKKIKQGAMIDHAVLRVPPCVQKDSVCKDGPDLSFEAPALRHAKYNVSTFIAHRMEELGVRDWFGVPGDSNLTLLDNLMKNPSLSMVACCNELNTGYAADGYARKSRNKIAVVVVPYIVGGLSIMNAISGALNARLKVIVISGCPNTDMMTENKLLHHMPSAGNKDHALKAYEGITAAAVRVDSPETAVDTIDDAIVKCVDQSAPVYIEIANNMADAACDDPVPLNDKLPKSLPPEKTTQAVEAITDLWNEASKPVMILGSFTRHSVGIDRVLKLAEKLGCAILCQPDARWIAQSHPQYLGCIWPGVTNSEGERVVRESDLWLTIGGQWSDIHLVGLDDSELFHRSVDIDLDQLILPGGESIHPVSLRDIVHGLLSSNLEPKRASLTHSNAKLSGPIKGCLADLESPLSMAGLLQGIEKVVGEEDTLVADTGETWFAASRVTLPPGVDYHMQLAYASIGWGLPATLGSHLASSTGRTILLMGDGGFQMSAQELSTMIRMKINPVIFLFNNLGYKTETAVHEGPYNYISNWDYAKLATSFSQEPHAPFPNPYATQDDIIGQGDTRMFSTKVRTQGDLLSAIQRAQQEPDKLAFLECCIQPGDMTEELQRLGDRVGQAFDNRKDSGVSGLSDDDCFKPDAFEQYKPLLPEVALQQPQNAKGQTPLSASRLNVCLTTTPKPVPPLHSPELLAHKVCTDHMVQAHWSSEQGWDNVELVQYGPLSLMPVANTLHYGTSCFEGMKAYRGFDGKLRLFRPDHNCARLLASALRTCLPAFEPDELHKLVRKVLSVDAPKWLPADRAGSALYIRPTFIGTGSGLGLDVPEEALLYIILSYWPNAGVSANSPSPKQAQGLRLCTNPEDMVRAWPGGTGAVKLSANYGPSILAQKAAKESGYDQVLWLIGPDHQVTEAGASNFFVIWTTPEGQLQLITAPLDEGTILPGVTRRSILDLARQRLSNRNGNGQGYIATDLPDGSHDQVQALEVVESAFTIDDLVLAADEGRLKGAFAVGTACFIVPVAEIKHGDREINIDVDVVPHGMMLRSWMSDIVYGKEESPWTEVVEEEIAA